MSLRERLKDYINDIDYDIEHTQEAHEQLKYYIEEMQNGEMKLTCEKKLFKLKGELETMASINEVLKDILEEEK